MSKDEIKKKPASNENGTKGKISEVHSSTDVSLLGRIPTISEEKEEEKENLKEFLKGLELAAGPRLKALKKLKAIVKQCPDRIVFKQMIPALLATKEFKGIVNKSDIADIWKETFQAKDNARKPTKEFPFTKEIEPYAGEVNGAELVTEIQRRLETHIVFSNEGIQSYACALWVLATWCIDSFNYAPYLMITAPEKRCGKSQLLYLLANLSRKPLDAGSITASALFRISEKYQPTIFIDEVDSFLANDRDLQGIIKCGIERGHAYTCRTEKAAGGQMNEALFDSFGMKAFSGISAKNISDPISDRSITIELKRKLSTEIKPRIGDVDPEYWSDLNTKCAKFALDASEWLKTHKPYIPNTLSDRDFNKWNPLVNIAEYLDYCTPHEDSPTYYADKARQSADLLSNVEADMPVKIELLNDIRNVFNDPFIPSYKTEYILTTELLNILNNDTELRWNTFNYGKELSARQLANKLKEFGIEPEKIRSESNRRGYFKADFEEAFTRYLPKVAE